MELIASFPTWSDILHQPWHWAISGLALAVILFLMTYLGRSFGVSTTFKGFCTVAGAGRIAQFFNTPVQDHYWRFVFVAGAVVGGFVTSAFFPNSEAVQISEATLAHLQDWGISYPQGNGFLPTDIFNLGNAKGIMLAIIGGFLVGFGARYAGGCTSGHAITGLSHLQIPSLLSVIGFFIGGLLMTWGILPLLLG